MITQFFNFSNVVDEFMELPNFYICLTDMRQYSCTVKWIYDYLKNNNNFKSLPLFFYDDRYLPLGTFNVLII